MDNEILEFVTKFFINLGAKVSFLEKNLLIQDVPKEFEKYYGKKSPYNFVFSLGDLKEDAEFIDKSNYLLKTIFNYLEESGKTTLLRLDINEDFSKDFNKFVTFPNSKIKKFYLKKKFNLFFRFTFHTSFQYLNENEKIINEFFVADGKLINGDLLGYPIVEGKKTEIKIPDPKEAYFIAKENLKLKLLDKTQEISKLLNKKLELELFRIEQHFKNEVKEYEDNLNKNLQKLEQSKKEEDLDKIAKQKKTLQNLKNQVDVEELEKEKQRAIQIEKQKHMLNINNKLFNTTLIYYPLFCSKLILENENTSKEIEVSIDPLTKKLIPFKCETCDNFIDEIFLCTTGHAICKKCLTKCESCGKVFCKKCLFRKCEFCNKVICKDCYARCNICGKLMCKTHTKHDDITKKNICKNCLAKCEKCGEFKDPSGFRSFGKSKICESCFRNSMQKRALKGVFD